MSTECSACGKKQEPREKQSGDIVFTINQEWALWVTSVDKRPDLRICQVCMYEIIDGLCVMRRDKIK